MAWEENSHFDQHGKMVYYNDLSVLVDEFEKADGESVETAGSGISVAHSGGSSESTKGFEGRKEYVMRSRVIKRIIFGWLVLIVLGALLGKVSVAATSAGRSAADFLQIGVGARAAGLGGAFTAISEGPVASYWNPAGLSGIGGRQLMLSHFAWFQDVTLEHGTFAFPVRDNLVMATSVTYLNYGRIDGYDIHGASTGEISAYDFAAGLSIGADLRDDLSAGLTVKYVSQSMDSYRASTNAVDIGFKYYRDNFTVAATVSNLGTKLTFYNEPENLPATARFGLSITPFQSDLLAAFELEKEFYGGFTFRQGFELGFEDQYYIRTGYDFKAGADGGSVAAGLSMGVGVALTIADFNYAFTPQTGATSEDLHRFSVNFKLDH